MGYSFYVASKDKQISQADFDTAIDKLSLFNKKGFSGLPVCDISFTNPYYIRVSGSFSISGNYAEGFVLNLVFNLINLGYTPTVLSRDFEYGSEEDFGWINTIR